MSGANRTITFANAVNEAIDIAMTANESVICYGLGVTDPKGVFGTTSGLEAKYGGDRVFDMPTSENAMTGVGVGAALAGLYPIMTHQRLDFFLLAMDQLVNSAAKWHYMFGGNGSVPLTIRLIVGRGWGQGPTHAQNLHSWFAHIPGLKVVIPTNAYDAKGLLLSSIFDPNPVVFLEHRWLHNSTALVPTEDYRLPIGHARVVRPGSDISIVAVSYMVPEAERAAKFLKDEFNVNCEVIDLQSIRPIDWETIFSSVKKTGKLLVLDTGVESCSVAGEVIASCCTNIFQHLSAAPRRLCMPEVPEPTSPALTKNFYNDAENVTECVAEMLGLDKQFAANLRNNGKRDVPGEWFSGPF